MKIVVKTPIVILILFAISIGSMFYFSVNFSYQELANTQNQQPSKSVNFLVKNIELVINDHDGQPKAKLVTDKLQHDPQTKTTNLTTPKLEIKQDKADWFINSNSGEIIHHQDKVKKIKNIILSNNVVIKRQEDNKNLPFVNIFTNKLSYSPEHDLVTTDDDIQINTQESQTTAIGLKFYKTKQEVYLLSKVKTNYHKNNNQDINITSDKLKIDYSTGYLSYYDNVVLIQDDKELKADNMDLHFDKSAESLKSSQNNSKFKIKEIIAKNKDASNPVKYKEKNKTKAKTIRASANMITLDPNTNKITLKGNAIIEQDNKILTSELLYYDIKKEIAYMPSINNKRTKITFG